MREIATANTDGLLLTNTGKLYKTSTTAPTTDGFIPAYADGGGIVLNLPVISIVARGADALRRYEAGKQWRIAKFTEWYNVTIEAYVLGPEHNGAHRWNGWASPIMTVAQLREFIDAHSEMVDVNDDSYTTLTLRDDGVLVVYDSDHDESYTIEPVHHDGIGLVYEVQLGWTWDEDIDEE